MKRIVFALVLFLSVISIQAKTIHWLTFIDTTDRNVGEIDQNTRKILYARWIDMVNATLNEQGYNIHVMDIYGSKVTPENCVNMIKDLECEKDDIVMFYYVGHGTENTGTNKFPLMLMAQDDVNKFVPFSWVHESLKKKNARLTVSIAMCCNARQGAPGRIEPSFGVNYGNTYIDEDMANSIKKMFLNYKGDIIITSASPAESSWACNSNIGSTDYFTLNLLMQFNNTLPNKSNPSWDGMLEEIRDAVYSEVKNNTFIQSKYPGSTQTALWVPNLTECTAEDPLPPSPPEVDNTTNEKTLVMTQLTEALAFITSSQADEMDRITQAKKLKDAFADNLIVRIVSQDGNTVVDKEKISTFLGRMSTSSSIMNVAIDDLDVNQDSKIASLRVRLFYKK